ncbi:cysteine dioxygenase family protein [Francisella orientalis]|nr:cysteine dioxygenase family protein [Francisella orientalis]MBK2008620.1 cysteine dioxygenase family protein [Francisella orientalis]MBK2089820.1 cysteine dioxygenase family protein [Francisella orientalis]
MINIDILDSCCDRSDIYTRNLIYLSNSFEVILMKWPKGTGSLPHDHNGQDCIVVLNSSSLVNTNYYLDCNGVLKELNKKVIKENNIFKSETDVIHSISNISDTTSYSLHLYSKPIRQSKIYTEDSGEKELIELTYHKYI